MIKFYRHSPAVSHRDGARLPMHVIDTPLGAKGSPGILIRSAGKQLYDPDDGSLAGAWLFDEGVGEFVRDRSSYEYHGALVGPDWSNDGL